MGCAAHMALGRDRAREREALTAFADCRRPPLSADFFFAEWDLSVQWLESVQEVE
jgi:hypothetical protein